MSFPITSGKLERTKKVVVYGPEGIGKSTFASKFPNPLFIDTEGSTGSMSVARMPKPTSWEMLKQEIEQVISEKPCKTLVIDTFDWAESLCIEELLSKHQKSGIEDFGYGNGYIYEKEEIARFLTTLDRVIDAGIHVLLTAHAQLRKFSQPDELGEYDRWELKLGKKTGSVISPLIKEWADMLLFANYKTVAVAVNKEGTKFKAQGNNRVMYTQHHPCWDAKNRDGLLPELPFDFSAVAPVFAEKEKAVRFESSVQTPAPKYWYSNELQKAFSTPDGARPEGKVFEITEKDYRDWLRAWEMTEESAKASAPEEPKTEDAAEPSPAGIPQKLWDLMRANEVTESEIRKAVSMRGYYPEETPISAYDPEFVNGVLIGAWKAVYDMIEEQRKIPF